MGLRLAVRYQHARHRFLRKAQVTVTHAGEALPEAKGSASGNRTFDLRVDASGRALEGVIQVRMLVRGDPDVEAAPLLELDQHLELVHPPGGGAPVVRPVGGRFGDELDPRVRANLSGVGLTGAKQATIDLTVDTRFLDVTDYSAKRGSTTSYYDAKKEHHEVLFRLLEYTGPGGPRLWLTFLPWSLYNHPYRTDIPVLVFFRPTGDVYDRTQEKEQGAFDRMLRYVLDPEGAWPWYTRPTADTAVKGGWLLYPSCGFERQLSRSGKPVMLVAPLPNGSDYGVLRKGSRTPLRPFLESIVALLWADGLLGEKKSKGLHPGRTAVSGFSFGGTALFSCFAANQDHLDEIYCFDPNDFPGNAPALKAWVQKDPQRRLRMAGGFDHNHGPMLQLAQSVGDPQRASTLPPSAQFWHEPGLYQAAATSPQEPEQLTELGQTPPPGSASDLSNVFWVPPDQGGKPPPLVTLEASWSGGKSRSHLRASRAEVAGVLRYDREIRGALPVTSAARFAKVLGHLQTYPHDPKPRFPEMRHSWAVIGGRDTAGKLDRGETFVGHLEDWLRQSGFE